MPRTPALDPNLSMFDTFTRGRHFVNPLNYCFLVETNDTLFVSFTTHRKIIQEYKVVLGNL